MSETRERRADELVARARASALKAYAPYSKFSVGCAIDLPRYAAAARAATVHPGAQRYAVGYGGAAAPAAPPPTRLYHYMTMADDAAPGARARGRRRRRRSDDDDDGRQHPSITVSVFSSGKLWIVGATTPAQIDGAFEAASAIARQ